ncbi:MAG: hypothetical protein IKX18_08580 [Muribaculaceae bacterium]|nr:hypothetical protein [Muribaculaceae bacterium]
MPRKTAVFYLSIVEPPPILPEGGSTVGKVVQGEYNAKKNGSFLGIARVAREKSKKNFFNLLNLDKKVF